MDLKKAVFLGGAVLLLAACNSATAPNALVRDGGPAAVAKVQENSPPPPSAIGDPVGGLFGDCETGYLYRDGRDSSCATPEAP
jgi:hypothetical protein